MNLRNRVQLIGNVGSDPQVKEFASGKKMARFNLATDDVKKVNGKFVKHTEWHTVTAWDKNAEVAEKNITIGSEVIIQGRVINNSFKDKDGNLRKISEILAESLIYRNIKQSTSKISTEENQQRA